MTESCKNFAGATALSPDDARRYSRNLMLDGIGEDGQRRLLEARVAIAGTGALGSIVAMYLAASGVGHIRIADFDTVDISNLQRQLSFTTADCGKLKSEATRSRLNAINPGVEVEIVSRLLTKDNIGDFTADADLIIEGTDNPATKYLVTDSAVAAGIPYILGGIAQWQGQVTSWHPGCRTYRQIFPEQAAEGSFTPCALGGVLGPLPGIVGSVMATEAIKIITSAGRPLYDRLWTINALTLTTRTLNL